MFKRKILEKMFEWKSSPLSKRKAIVIKGLRQTGKTFTALQYANALYKNVIYINFKENDSMRSVFDGDLNVDRMITDISAMMPNVRFVPGETILVLDEIQECANARASIKPFMNDGRFDVICTGSLLGIKGYNKKKGKGVPTGFEHTIYMKPMDFEEFLWAKGIGVDAIDYVKECFREERKISDSVHTAMLRHFSEYICVGGLPHVVDTFLTTHDMNSVREELKDIIEEYKDDFGKHLDEFENEYTDGTLLARINSVFDSIPAQLSKENKKFQYTLLKKNARGDEYRAAIQWLIDAGMISVCNNLNLLQLPLEGNKDESVFKIYMQDSGLFTAMLEPGSAGDILSGNLGIYKGAIYEEMVADAFSKMGRKLYYYRRESGSEIDFVTRYRGKITLVEIKAGKGKVKSSDHILANYKIYGVDSCIKFGKYNIGRMGKVLTAPFYTVFLLEDPSENPD